MRVLGGRVMPRDGKTYISKERCLRTGGMDVLAYKRDAIPLPALAPRRGVKIHLTQEQIADARDNGVSAVKTLYEMAESTARALVDGDLYAPELPGACEPIPAISLANAEEKLRVATTAMRESNVRRNTMSEYESDVPPVETEPAAEPAPETAEQPDCAPTEGN